MQYLRTLLFAALIVTTGLHTLAQTTIPQRADRMFSTGTLVLDREKRQPVALDIQIGDSEAAVMQRLKTQQIREVKMDQSGRTSRGKAYRIFQCWMDYPLGTFTLLFSDHQLVYFSINGPHRYSTEINQEALAANKQYTVIAKEDDIFRCVCGYDVLLVYDKQYAALYHKDGYIGFPTFHFFYVEALQIWLDDERHFEDFIALLSMLRCVRHPDAEKIYIDLTVCHG